MPPYSASISTFSILLLLGGGLLIFIQRVELLYDLRLFQFDDLAGEVVEGIFLGDVEEADTDGAEGLRLSCRI